MRSFPGHVDYKIPARTDSAPELQTSTVTKRDLISSPVHRRIAEYS
jgi:hypothetical protein